MRTSQPLGMILLINYLSEMKLPFCLEQMGEVYSCISITKVYNFSRRRIETDFLYYGIANKSI